MKFSDFKQTLLEGVYDPGIFKAFFLAGGAGSGSLIVQKRQLDLQQVNLNGLLIMVKNSIHLKSGRMGSRLLIQMNS